ncbi:MAG: PP2C family serine/threonine-protein phosphatase [Microbacteriaceae bacterium]
MTLGIRADAVSHVGKIRANNQDSGYAGNHLFVVADGMGGYAGGDVASAIAISVVESMDLPQSDTDQAKDQLHASIIDANTAINAAVDEHPELARMGTTMSAILRVGDQAVIAHIGDSRIYLNRDGKLRQITTDHTFVQRLVEAGRITPEEALVHPRRSVIMRVLGDVEMEPEVDLEILDLKAGDRWLLCSDGLSGYVPEPSMEKILNDVKDIRQANKKMLDIALSNGAPDNVTGVILEITAKETDPIKPMTVGSASDPNVSRGMADKRMFSFGMLRHPITAVQQIEAMVPEDQDSYLESLIAADRRRARFRQLRWLLSLLIIIGIATAALWVGYNWTQQQYYVGVQDGYVTIFQGIPQNLGPITLSEALQQTDVLVSDLQLHWQQGVTNNYPATSLENAVDIVEQLRTHVSK